MPNKGNYYITKLKKTHLGWGTHRKTYSRPRIVNEGYIPIPIQYATKFNITNLHNKKQHCVYKFSTSDNFYTNKELKASGNRKKNCPLAKNLHGNGDLKLLGFWFNHLNAKPNDKIKVEFLSSTEILLTFIQTPIKALNRQYKKPLKKNTKAF